MSQLWTDLRYAARMLALNPAFSAILILILALGIGANTAIFSMVDGVLLRPLTFREPDRLFAVEEQTSLPVNAMHFLEWRKRWSSAESIALVTSFTMNLTSSGEPQRLIAGRVSANLFPMLGIHPKLGRSFLEEEDRAGREQVVILSDGLWQRAFQADPSIVGRKIVLDGVPHEVVGVLAAGAVLPKQSQLMSFQGGSDSYPELWRPFAVRDAELTPFGDFNYGCIARLKRGIPAAQAAQELNAIQSTIARGLSADISLDARITPLQEEMTGRSRQGLLLLLAAVGAVLLIVCANVANLLLVRAAARQREFAIRAAIGAGVGRLVRQTFTESLLISVLGGALGLVLAYWLLAAIIAKAPVDLPRVHEIELNGRVLAVAALLSTLSGLLFGILPAWRIARIGPQSGLRAGGRSYTGDKRRSRARSLLISLEVALSTICLIAAGLLLNSFVKLLSVDKGFDPRRATTVSLRLPAIRYPERADRTEFFHKLLTNIEALPGVTAAGITNKLPLTGEGSNNVYTIPGSGLPITQRPSGDFRLVSPNYFRAMGIPLKQGRVFEDSDRPRHVILVGELTAKRLWPGENPIGKKLHVGGTNWPLEEVVGVMGDLRNSSLQKAPGLTVYLPYWERDRPDMSLVVRGSVENAALGNAVRREIRRLDAGLPVPQFRPLDTIVSASVEQRRFQLILVLTFAGIALVLASLGIYGVVSYSVAQRRGEMGVRSALGATPGDLARLVVVQGLTPVLAGLAAGVAGALAAGRLIAGLLYGVKPGDALTIASVAGVLLLVGTLACYVPALRVTRTDPLIALRYE